jgi:AraC-like DNA-binding protein
MKVCLHRYIIDLLLEKSCLKQTKIVSDSNIMQRVSPPPSEQTHLAPLGFRIWPIDPAEPMSASHTHGEIEVNFLTRGRICYLHGGREVWVEPFRFTALWAGLPHWSHSVEGNPKGIWMTLPLAWLLHWRLPHQLPARLFAGEAVSSEPNSADLPLLEKWVKDIGAGAKLRRVLLLEIEARFHRLAMTLPSWSDSVVDHRAIPTHVERATNYIVRHYQEPLSVARIAEALGLHEKYLMQFFKQETGLTVWEYVMRMRVAHAQQLLAATDMKIINVAMESGFASLGPFYRAFKAYSPHLPRPWDYRCEVGRIPPVADSSQPFLWTKLRPMEV